MQNFIFHFSVIINNKQILCVMFVYHMHKLERVTVLLMPPLVEKNYIIGTVHTCHLVFIGKGGRVDTGVEQCKM